MINLESYNQSILNAFEDKLSELFLTDNVVISFSDYTLIEPSTDTFKGTIFLKELPIPIKIINPNIWTRKFEFQIYIKFVSDSSSNAYYNIQGISEYLRRYLIFDIMPKGLTVNYAGQTLHNVLLGLELPNSPVIQWEQLQGDFCVIQVIETIKWTKEV